MKRRLPVLYWSLIVLVPGIVTFVVLNVLPPPLTGLTVAALCTSIPINLLLSVLWPTKPFGGDR